MTLENIAVLADRIKQNIQTVIIGKSKTIDLMLTALFSEGHVLIEDTPGTGKTLLAKSLAASLDTSFHRIQFTPDLLPSDITGLHMFHPRENEFQFIPGPAFTNILLADEINRATPRTQSALLECMAETQITIDGTTYSLKSPFFVMATENPVETSGTFPLPEAELDRFLLRLPMKPPSSYEELQMLNRFIDTNPFDALKPVCKAADITEAARACRSVFVHKCVRQYIVDLVQASRTHSAIRLGASPRSALALLRACQSYAAIKGDHFVTPDHVKALCVPVLAHRLLLINGATTTKDTEGLVTELLGSVSVPTEDWSTNSNS